MSNKASSHLFELIQSLSKSEKRYFKVLSSKHVIGEENKYIQLFDFMDDMDDYDENMIMEHFKGEAFLNKFSITKSRLYDHILKSLEQFHSSHSVDAQIYNLLNCVDILQNKTLYKQAHKLLRSAEKLAVKNDRYSILMEISLKRKRLLEKQNYADIKPKELEDFLHQDAERLEKLKNYMHLWSTKSELFYIINKKNRTENESEIQSLREQIKQFDTLPDSSLFFDSMYLKNHINSAYCFYIGDFECSLNYLTKNIDLFQESPNRIKQDPTNYVSVLVNTVFIAHKIGKKIVFRDSLNELKNFSDRYKIELTEDIEIKMFSSTASLELSIMINSGEFEKAAILIPEIESSLEKFDSKINTVRKSFLYFQIAYAYFGNGQFKESLKWVNKILNSNTSDKDELFGYANLFNLILHYELENSRLLPYTLKSVERLYGRKDEEKSFEKLFLNYFKKIIKKEKEINKKELFYDLHENIQTSSEKHAIPMEYFRFDYWVEAKAKNKEFASLFH